MKIMETTGMEQVDKQKLVEIVHRLFASACEESTIAKAVDIFAGGYSSFHSFFRTILEYLFPFFDYERVEPPPPPPQRCEVIHCPLLDPRLHYCDWCLRGTDIVGEHFVHMRCESRHTYCLTCCTLFSSNSACRGSKMRACSDTLNDELSKIATNSSNNNNNNNNDTQVVDMLIDSTNDNDHSGQQHVNSQNNNNSNDNNDANNSHKNNDLSNNSSIDYYNISSSIITNNPPSNTNLLHTSEPIDNQSFNQLSNQPSNQLHTQPPINNQHQCADNEFVPTNDTNHEVNSNNSSPDYANNNTERVNSSNSQDNNNENNSSNNYSTNSSNNYSSNDSHNKNSNNSDTNHQSSNIKSSDSKEIPLLGSITPLQNLKLEYHNPVIKKKIEQLCQVYNFEYFMSVRGDGNCFYRAAGMALLQLLVEDKIQYGHFYKIFQDFTAGKVEFQNSPLGLLLEILDGYHKEDNPKSDSFVHNLIYEDNISEDSVKILRLMTSHSLRTNEIYKFFVESEDAFIKRCTTVEVMGNEAEHLEINALLSFLGLSCKLFQLDRNADLPVYHLPDETHPPQFFLLYRPGHYDLLYKVKPQKDM